MKCCRLFISTLLLILSFSYQTKAQGAAEQRFDAMVNEIMMGFLNRDAWQNTDTLLKVMAIEPMERIAEVGAGEGYLTLKLAREVGPDGKLQALESNSFYINKLKLLKRYDNLEQIEVIKIQPNALKLEAQSLDKVVLMDNYHGFTDYEDLLKQCREALKPGGKIFIIDSCVAKMDNDKAVRKKLFKKQSIRAAMVGADLEANGFSLEQTLDKFTVQEGKINWFMVVGKKN